MSATQSEPNETLGRSRRVVKVFPRTEGRTAFPPPTLSTRAREERGHADGPAAAGFS
jgi:hypothetical protein